MKRMRKINLDVEVVLRLKLELDREEAVTVSDCQNVLTKQGGVWKERRIAESLRTLAQLGIRETVHP
jgi:hypothetical protein